MMPFAGQFSPRWAGKGCIVGSAPSHPVRNTIDTLLRAILTTMLHVGVEKWGVGGCSGCGCAASVNDASVNKT